MKNPVTTQAIEDYLKVIFKLQREHGAVTTSLIADWLGLSAASVTNMVKRLAEMKLVRHTPYYGVTLTPAGEKIALEVIRHHRLLELYLAEALGVPLDRVDAEAERLEHVLSEELEDRLDEALGHPTVDPHGDPIPTKSGELAEPDLRSLAELETGEQAVVRRVSDRDAAVLRYIGELGLTPNATISVRKKAPFKGPLLVKVGNAEHMLDRELATQILVALLEDE